MLKETEDREKERLNKVSAKLNIENILPDTDRSHNTRRTTPLRRHHNEREQRLSSENFNYSDNLDEHHLDSPPNKKSKRKNTPRTLREPSVLRQNAQRIITRGELQCSVSPEFTRKLIGTYVKVKDENEEKSKLKLKIKEEEECIMSQVNTRGKDKSWPKDARLVHVDRTPCSQECMKTHSDDDNVEPVPNKKSSKTYGKPSTVIQRTLTGVPDGRPTKTTFTDGQQESADTNIEDTGSDNITDKPLPAVPKTVQSEEGTEDSVVTNCSVEKTQSDEPTGSAALDRDPSIENPEMNTNMSVDEPALPDIGKSTPGKTSPSKIDLECELSAKNVNQIDTEILEELSEFSNLLNLDEDNEELPLVNTSNSVPDSAMDLEIVMENTKFLENHPMVPGKPSMRRSRQRTYTTNAVLGASGTPHSFTSSDVGPNTSTSAHRTSRKGTIQITTHVLRRPTPEEAKTKKFRCEACEFTGYSHASVSIH